MANLRHLAKDTAIYGLSSIVGRFLNYLLVPLYTHCMPRETGDYGISTNVYAYVALILVILTFGMETTLFRFANSRRQKPDTVFSTAFIFVAALSLSFLALVALFITPISQALGYATHHDYLLMMAGVVCMDAMQAIPFSYLRFQKRPLAFASLKLLFIALNILLNCLFFLALGKAEALYIFRINLWCTAFVSLLFLPMLCRVRWRIDLALLRSMLAYSWPLLALGVAGILNQTADKLIFPLAYPDKAQAQVQLGIYGACVKIAMIMALITQAFRYAYEPIVFAKRADGDRSDYYASAMKAFILLTLLAFLCVVGYLPLLSRIIGAGYREGLRVVPVVMAAEMMMGVYFNLSFWYKLADKTIYGAWFSLAGCAVLFAVNIWGIPRFGYMACAWGGFAGYGVAMILSFLVGQAKSPIRYPLASIAAFTGLAVLLFTAMWCLTSRLPAAPQMLANTVLIALFASLVMGPGLHLTQALRRRA